MATSDDSPHISLTHLCTFIAIAIGITERTAHKIIFDLDTAGCITRNKVGRRNVYDANSDLPMRHPARRSVTIGDLLHILTPARRRR